MATLAQILKDTQAAVEAVVVGLTPNTKKSVKFWPRPIEDRVGTQPIEEMATTPRMFEVQIPVEIPLKEEWEGAGNRGKRMTIDIVIQYPNINDWLIAAHDDADVISNYLLSNHNSIAAGVTGLELCTTDKEQSSTLEVGEDKQHLILRVPLFVLVEIE